MNGIIALKKEISNFERVTCFFNNIHHGRSKSKTQKNEAKEKKSFEIPETYPVFFTYGLL
jgi:hypothetical protein